MSYCNSSSWPPLARQLHLPRRNALGLVRAFRKRSDELAIARASPAAPDGPPNSPAQNSGRMNMPVMLLTSPPRRRAARYRRSDNRTTAKPVRHHDEEKIHAATIQHLQLRSVPGVVWWHTPNESIAHVAHRVKLKRLGAKAGVADLVLLHAGKIFCLEIKTAKGRATDAQRDFIDAVNAAGGHAAIGRGLNHCLQILEGWRLLSRQAQCAIPAGSSAMRVLELEPADE